MTYISSDTVFMRRISSILFWWNSTLSFVVSCGFAFYSASGDPAGYVYYKDGITTDIVNKVMELKNVTRGTLAELNDAGAPC